MIPRILRDGGLSEELLRHWNAVLAGLGLSMWRGYSHHCTYTTTRRVEMFVQVIADTRGGCGGGRRVTNFRFSVEELRVTDTRSNSKRKPRKDKTYATAAEKQRAYRARKAEKLCVVQDATESLEGLRG